MDQQRQVKQEVQGQRSVWVEWGRMVQVAYEMYGTHKLSPATPENFPSGWRHVANLTMAPHVFSYKEKEFAGFIAQSLLHPLHYAVAIRGTESPLDWLSDLEFVLEPFHEVPDAGKTEKGFTDLYRSMTVHNVEASALEPEPEPLRRFVEKLPREAALAVTGHSLGAAIATLHALDAAQCLADVTCVTFASPRVGNHAFAKAFASRNIRHSRIFNHPDLVPKVPVELAGYLHVEPGYEISSLTSPIKHSVLCCHSLQTYLYLLGDPNADISSCRLRSS
ncbi:lipase family protein [Xylanibacillus composti]|uniref:Lipase n=1 Tax=Xylanibacillus composti TaxID=1572762 RepID=A0A8J4M2D4_9BACL|nr:lipase family protein [Xylanibacillus composti]MDT9726043.1 lipase family protein [Xylanibacillus composti]GIQ68812.1 lipase [Xylanibacillus composti]